MVRLNKVDKLRYKKQGWTLKKFTEEDNRERDDGDHWTRGLQKKIGGRMQTRFYRTAHMPKRVAWYSVADHRPRDKYLRFIAKERRHPRPLHEVTNREQRKKLRKQRRMRNRTHQDELYQRNKKTGRKSRKRLGKAFASIYLKGVKRLPTNKARQGVLTIEGYPVPKMTPSLMQGARNKDIQPLLYAITIERPHPTVPNRIIKYSQAFWTTNQRAFLQRHPHAKQQHIDNTTAKFLTPRERKYLYPNSQTIYASGGYDGFRLMDR